VKGRFRELASFSVGLGVRLGRSIGVGSFGASLTCVLGLVGVIILSEGVVAGFGMFNGVSVALWDGHDRSTVCDATDHSTERPLFAKGGKAGPWCCKLWLCMHSVDVVGYQCHIMDM
jgi:hypothetical protein